MAKREISCFSPIKELSRRTVSERTHPRRRLSASSRSTKPTFFLANSRRSRARARSEKQLRLARLPGLANVQGRLQHDRLWHVSVIFAVTWSVLQGCGSNIERRSRSFLAGPANLGKDCLHLAIAGNELSVLFRHFFQ